MTIRPKNRFLNNFFFLSTRPCHLKLGSSLIEFFYLYTTIRPKIRVLINLIFLFAHDHSTKVRGDSYSLIYHCPSCVNISFAIFMAYTAFIMFRGFCFKWYCFYVSCGLIHGSTTVIYSVHCIHGGTALIFRTLCPWLYEVFSSLPP